MPSRLPFSGDVTQAINPWSFLLRQVSQFGIINVNLAKTPSPALEQTILEEVGSYGRQIGRLADALDVVLGTLDRASLTEPQLAAILAFREQLAEVRAIKAAGRSREDRDLAEPAPRLRDASLPRTGRGAGAAEGAEG